MSRTHFSAERLASLNAEKQALRDACLQAAREFEKLIRPDLDAEPRPGYFTQTDHRSPWAAYRSNRSYAYQYGSAYVGEKFIRYSEDRFGDEFELPLEFLHDPDGWTERYRAACAQYREQAERERQREEREDAERQARYEREQYARLKAKFEDGEADDDA